MTTADRSVTGSRGPGHPYPSEADLMRSIQLRASDLGLRAWRNNVGMLVDHRGTHVRYGLAVGSSDLIGIRPVLVTPSHVGQVIGQFLSLEVKSRTGKPTGEQTAWLATVTRLGGIAGVIRSIADLEALLCR